VKPAVLRPQARQDLRSELRYYRKKAGARVATRLVDALESDLRTLQRQPAIGAPTLGQELGITNLRTWEVSGFPLLLVYIEHPQHLDVVRVLGERQDIATI
jgi:toxin ParE1/3/4